jgi:hypothetical protein
MRPPGVAFKPNLQALIAMDRAIRPMVEKYLRKQPEKLRQTVAVTGRYHYTDSPFAHRFSAFGWSVATPITLLSEPR